jgi:hypothetical protein
MKVYELLLEAPEDRIEYLAKTMGPKLVTAAEKDHSLDREVASDPVKIATMLAEFDPSKNKQALAWITKQYTLGAFKSEDKNKIKSSLELFSKVGNKLNNKDLMSYKDLSSLYDALAPFEKSDAVELSAKQQAKMVKSDAEKIIDTPNFKVIVPKTEAASQMYGAGTKWCTAAQKECMFDSYSNQGPLYIIIAGSGERAKKFQLHYETNSFMDARDTPIKAADIKYLSGFPQYADFLNMLIKKHYSKFIDTK